MAHYSGRKSKRQKCDPDQQNLLYGNRDPLRTKLRSIDCRVAGVGPVRMKQIVELAMAVWLASGDGERICCASRSDLLRLANANSSPGAAPIGSLGTLARVLEDATRLGIIRSVQAAGPSLREIDDDRIRELVKLTCDRARMNRECDTTATRVRRECDTTETRHYISPLPSPLPTKENSRSSQLAEAVRNWLAYKSERGQSYKPTGLRYFQSRIDKLVLKHGDTAVIEAINQAITATWMGFEHSLTKNTQGPPQQPANGFTFDPEQSETDRAW